MNYDQARQVDPTSGTPDAGKWRYTTHNRRVGTYAIGYCADCPGHDTEQEANEHQTAYLLDECLQLDRKMLDQQLKCEARVPTGGVNISGQITAPPTGTERCGTYTESFAMVGEWQMFVLCDKHRTRDVVADLLGTVGASIHS